MSYMFISVYLVFLFDLFIFRMSVDTQMLMLELGEWGRD